MQLLIDSTNPTIKPKVCHLNPDIRAKYTSEGVQFTAGELTILFTEREVFQLSMWLDRVKHYIRETRK